MRTFSDAHMFVVKDTTRCDCERAPCGGVSFFFARPDCRFHGRAAIKRLGAVRSMHGEMTCPARERPFTIFGWPKAEWAKDD